MMLTRCPRCATTFRVTPDQLKIRQGKVRCGKCQSVFNALETLDEEASIAIAARESSIPIMAAVGPTAVDPTPEHQPLPSLPPLPPLPPLPDLPPVEDDPITEPLPEAEPPPVAAAPPEIKAAPRPAIKLEPPAMPAPQPHSWPPAPELVLQEEEPPQRRTWPWWLGSLLALCALSLQGMVHFRTELAVIAPQAKPALQAICQLVGCRLGLPSKIDLIGIETSDLIPDKERPGHLQLLASLRNRAPFAQAWPHLEVTLTDASDRALLRRALAPADYLPSRSPASEGLPPRGEQAIQLALQATDVPAVGYRLYVFYP